MNNSIILKTLLSILFTTSAAWSATLSGFINDREDGEVMPYVTVTLEGAQLGAISNTRGYYAIRQIPVGTYIITASRIGYKTARDTLYLAENDDARLDLRLETRSIELAKETQITADRLEEEQVIQTSFISIAADNLQQLPAIGEADLLRSLQLLPGIQSASDISSGLYVRGGGPDQTRILLDEIPLYNPSHAFGFFSTFNPDAIKDVNLYKGAYPAAYGGNLGALLDVSNSEGNREKFHLKGGVSLIASRILAAGPMGRGSWMIAGRRTYLDPLLAVLRSRNITVPNYYFYDFNGKFNQQLNTGDTFVTSTYFGRDDLNFNLDEATNTFINIRWGNQALSFLWSHIFSPAFFGRFIAAGSVYESETSLSFFDTPIHVKNSIQDFTLKGDFDYFASSAHTLTSGFSITYYSFLFNQKFNQQEQLGLNEKPYLGALYLQDEWHPQESTRLRVGSRASYFSKGNRWYLMPRFSLSQEIIPGLQFKLGGGGYRQYLQLITTEGFSGGDFWVPLDDTVTPGRSWQAVTGLTFEPSRSYQFSLETYYTDLANLIVLDNNVAADNDITRSVDIFKTGGSGYATGIEFFIQKRTGRLTGWFGYTLGWTRRKFPDLNGGRTFPPKYDRRHDLSFVCNYQRGAWRWGANLVYATGQAFTPATARYSLRTPATGVVNDYVLPADRNSARLLPYHRLDLNLRREFGLGSGKAAFYIQIFNVYSRRNEWFIQYKTDDPTTEPEVVKQLPIVPTLGIDFNF